MMLNSRTYRSSSQRRGFFAGVDLVAILLYVVIVTIGCICITSSSFDELSPDIFDTSHFYIKQIIWVCIAFVIALVVLLFDASIFHKYSYLLYIFGIVLLILTLLFGREVNGAKSWFEFGSMRIQPVEIVKITTSIAVSRVMSEYSFSITNTNSLMRVAAVVALPLMIIILQNDTGSGIVFCSFLIVLYREGLSKWLCLPAILISALFISSLLISQFALLVIILLCSIIFDMFRSGELKLHTIYLASLLLTVLLLKSGALIFLRIDLDSYTTLLVVSLAASLVIAWQSIRTLAFSRLWSIGIFIFSALFVRLSEFIFSSILMPHQRGRIMSFLGIIDDPLGKDYNVNQAKIAIGSGGLLGKGFLEGTQIRYGFVPERHTDFIFCSLAEEWGFVGVILLMTVMMAMVLKLLAMGERQKESFGRIYCYCVASILLFHIFVNIGMTIGLMPVMGIPLPFMSYGGSSLVAFTTMLFIAFRLDAAATATS